MSHYGLRISPSTPRVKAESTAPQCWMPAAEDHRLGHRLQTGLHSGGERPGHSRSSTAARSWRDRSCGSRSPVHLLSLHPDDPLRWPVAIIRDRRRRPGQCDDGILLGDDADRTADPEEVEDPNRAGERDLRVHRSVLQPSTLALLPPIRDAARLRPRPNPAGTHRHRKLAIESGNQAIGQVKLLPSPCTSPT